MLLDMFMAAHISALAPIQGRPKMATHTPYIKSQTDNHNSFIYWQREAGNSANQTDTLTEIALNDIKRLISDFAQLSINIGCNDLEIAQQIFTGVFISLYSNKVDLSQMAISKTPDNSILMKGNAGEDSFYFETYFDEEEYLRGYEIILNFYQNKKMALSVSGSIDFVLDKLNTFLTA
jgi:hypothetical protein